MRVLRAVRRCAAQHSVGFLALFISMTGTAGAASAMWTGANIVPGSITGSNIASNTITSNNIQNGTITGADLAPGAVAFTPLATFDSGDTTYTESAWAPFNAADTSAPGPTTTLTSVAFTTAQAGWVDFRGEVGSDSYSFVNGAGCGVPDFAREQNLMISRNAAHTVTTLVDGHVIWNPIGSDSAEASHQLLSSVIPMYLAAGSHTLTMTVATDGQCAYYTDASFVQLVEATGSGTYTMSDVHLDLTSAS